MRSVLVALAANLGIAAVSRLVAAYLGASEVLVAADVLMGSGLRIEDAARALATARLRIRQDVPAIARLYLTPVPRDQGASEA
jgi:hypothetical protein